MAATVTDVLGDTIANEVRRGVTEALEPLVAALKVLDEPRPAVWTPAEAGIVLGVSETTVRRWVRAGHLDRLPGVDTMLIPRRAVEEFLDPAARRHPEAKAS